MIGEYRTMEVPATPEVNRASILRDARDLLGNNQDPAEVVASRRIRTADIWPHAVEILLGQCASQEILDKEEVAVLSEALRENDPVLKMAAAEAILNRIVEATEPNN